IARAPAVGIATPRAAYTFLPPEDATMADPLLEKTDPLDDFEHRQITLQDKTKLVFVAGSGPAVVVMTEMPGISPHVARFARWIRDAGFTVCMPSLFGNPGRPVS